MVIYREDLNIYVDGENFLNEVADLKAVLIPRKMTGTFHAAAAYVVSYN